MARSRPPHHHPDPAFESAYLKMLGSCMGAFVHELNNPLTALTNTVNSLAQTEGRDAFASEILDILRRTNLSLIRKSTALKALVEADARKPYTDLTVCCRMLMQTIRARFGRRGIGMEVRMGEDQLQVGVPPRETCLLLYCLLDLLLVAHALEDAAPTAIRASGIREAEGGCLVRFVLPQTSSALLDGRAQAQADELLPDELREAVGAGMVDLFDVAAATAAERGVAISWRFEKDAVSVEAVFPASSREASRRSGWIG